MKLKAVIAEDDFRIAAIHEKFLGNFKNIEVVGKGLNGEETMEILKKQETNLLLLDVYMPDRLGTDLLPLIREKFPKIDIIMITAAADKEIFEKALHYGVEYFLVKPVNIDRFKQTIEEYLYKHELMKSKQEVDQDFVDLIFKKSPATPAGKVPESSLPKGIDEITLEKVRSVLEKSGTGMSAEQVSEQLGVSRITARRYLEYMITVKECKAEAVYGAIGRPERRYLKVYQD